MPAETQTHYVWDAEEPLDAQLKDGKLTISFKPDRLTTVEVRFSGKSLKSFIEIASRLRTPRRPGDEKAVLTATNAKLLAEPATRTALLVAEAGTIPLQAFRLPSWLCRTLAGDLTKVANEIEQPENPTTH